MIRTIEPDKNAKFINEELSFNFATILPNGNFRIDFSESFHKLEKLWTGGRNFTLLNLIRHEILELNFTSDLEYELKSTKEK